MTHAANDTRQTVQIFTTLANEAWQQLGSRPLADLTVAEIAAHVDVEAGLAVAVAGDPQQLVLRKMAALDDQAVLESFADIEDAGAVPIREKILEAIIFSSTEPLSINYLKKSCPFIEDIGASLKSLMYFYSNRAVNLVKINNTYAFRTSPYYSNHIAQKIEKKVVSKK